MQLANLIVERAVDFIPVLLALTVHEWAHAWTAWKLGDDTAKMLGRVSLNPLDHIDPVGTLLLPLLGIPFGWAKPVPFNPVRFRTSISMPLGVFLVAAAGPISNSLLAVLGCAGLVVVRIFFRPDSADDLELRTYFTLFTFLHQWVLINIALALFNLLPIPPLDGSRIVDASMPTALRPYWSRFSALGPFLLIAVILLPAYFGISFLYWPMVWTNDLLMWIMR
jgi:Zn-dependent protease